MKHIEPPDRLKIPVAVSARHVHPSQATLDRLFGPGYVLAHRHELSQPGQFAAVETVTLVGPAGRIDGVRLLGPPRGCDQVEISRTDAVRLGVPAPLRLSGELQDTPGLELQGPAGSVPINHGLIVAKRHVHMRPADAQRFDVAHGDVISVLIDSAGRDVAFGDVVVRVSPEFRLEMHLDTDEANAAGVQAGDTARLLRRHAGR